MGINAMMHRLAAGEKDFHCGTNQSILKEMIIL